MSHQVFLSNQVLNEMDAHVNVLGSLRIVFSAKSSLSYRAIFGLHYCRLNIC